MKNSAGQGGCYPPRGLQNSSYPTKALLLIQNIFFAKTCKHTRFRSLLNTITLSPGFLGQWFNNL